MLQYRYTFLLINLLRRNIYHTYRLILKYNTYVAMSIAMCMYIVRYCLSLYHECCTTNIVLEMYKYEYDIKYESFSFFSKK